MNRRGRAASTWDLPFDGCERAAYALRESHVSDRLAPGPSGGFFTRSSFRPRTCRFAGSSSSVAGRIWARAMVAPQARALRYTSQISRRACQACGLSHNRQGNSPRLVGTRCAPVGLGMAADWRSSILGSTTWGKVLIIMSAVVARGRPQVELSFVLRYPPTAQIANGAALGMSPRGSVRGREVTGAGDIQHRMDYTPRVPCGLRCFWSITVYVDPRAGTCASGNGQNRAGLASRSSGDPADPLGVVLKRRAEQEPTKNDKRWRQSRPQESERDDKWSFCLTAGTLCPANQEKQ